MYQPNFCAQCGTNVLRLRWHIWHSRKFCSACARKFRQARLLQPLLLSLALIVSGYVVGRSRRPPAPPLTIERRADSPLSDNPVESTSNLATADSGSSAAGEQGPSTVDEEVYLCGARTKKGTPCSRRVPAPRRCWQHKGMPAILPPEKLQIKG